MILNLLFTFSEEVFEMGINYNRQDLYAKIVEVNHIEYFTKSFNNNSDNIIIICPNHHRLIHKVKPIFDKTNHILLYKNGYKEKLTLNYHL